MRERERGEGARETRGRIWEARLRAAAMAHDSLICRYGAESQGGRGSRVRGRNIFGGKAEEEDA